MNIKVTHSIVNEERGLIGFRVQGREKDFGGMSNEIIDTCLSVQALAKMNFQTSKISVNPNGRVIVGKNFSLNSLPMLKYVGGNGEQYIPIDNSVQILSKFEKCEPDNGKRTVLGFRLKFGDGFEDNFRYEHVMLLSTYFKPTNFCVKSKPNGTGYIQGINGTSMSTIPCTVVGKAPERVNKRPEPSKAKKIEQVGKITNDFDILDVYEIINKADGCVIRFIGDNYVPVSNEKVSSEEFVSFNTGEVASPKLKFNPSKLNVNANFKKPGKVYADFGMGGDWINTFVHRTKSIFVAGEKYADTFGVAIPKVKENEFISTIAGTMGIEKVTDINLIKPLEVAVNNGAYTFDDYSFFRIKLGKIDLISKNRMSNSILSAEQIAKICQRMCELKIVNKAMSTRGGLLGELKEKLGPEGISKATNKPPFGIFKYFNKDQLIQAQNMGFDIYTGAYIKAPTVSKAAGSGDTETKVEIVYSLKGYDPGKITGKAALEFARKNDTSKMSKGVVDMINHVDSIGDLNVKYAEANKVYYQTESEIEKLNKILWMHNASMFLTGNKSKVHTHDNTDWVIGASRAKSAEVYTNTKVNGLAVKVTGVTI